MISGKAIHKSYDKLHVLKGVDVEVSKGEIVSIVGKSGAGKSTLLHILGTLDNFDNGSLVINGVEMANLSERELASFRNEQIGFVFQFHHLLPEFTAVENVCIPAFIANKNEAESKKRATELLEYLGLGDRLEHKPTELSGGEQQRVALARCLLRKQPILLLDEPFSALDESTRHDMIKLTRQVIDDHSLCVVLVTHNEDDAELLGATKYRLLNGELAQEIS